MGDCGESTFPLGTRSVPRQITSCYHLYLFFVWSEYAPRRSRLEHLPRTECLGLTESMFPRYSRKSFISVLFSWSPRSFGRLYFCHFLCCRAYLEMAECVTKRMENSKDQVASAE
ncbi:unnamed protein product [Ascophyllum nodosum]